MRARIGQINHLLDRVLAHERHLANTIERAVPAASVAAVTEASCYHFRVCVVTLGLVLLALPHNGGGIMLSSWFIVCVFVCWQNNLLKLLSVDFREILEMIREELV